jgi:NAD(P)-dependent dehydrogenase (short-subunit alcohol dehydrogenase family)
VDRNEFFPGYGAITGLLKTVDVEWPEVRVKVVDLCFEEPVSDLADHLMAEIQTDDNLVEIGYHNSHRISLGLVDSPLVDRAEDLLQIDPSWVILVTGGARGITAAVAQALSRHYRPTLILVGRSPLPLEKESDVTARLKHPKDIKSTLAAGMKSRGEPATLAKVEATYRQLLKDREIRANIAAIKNAGANVEYHQVDVRNEKSFGNLIDKIHANYGHLDGIIHGAGIIEDKRLTDKSWESFDRVFGTKTDSIFVLSKKLRPETLKFLVLFSSVAGRFGNAGQCDYTAANDLLNKMAVYLDNRWSGRVLSVNWGPWAGGGMASAEVQRQFNQRGVALISPSQGSESLDLELRKGYKGESEVVIGEGPWRKAVEYADGDTVSDSDLPLLQNNFSIIKDDGFIEINRRLDPNQDLYLQDHRLDAKPVLPAAMAIELMAEAAQMGWPEWKITTVGDVRVFKGIVLNENSRNVRLIAQAKTDLSSSSKNAELECKITDSQQDEIIFYRATLILTKDLPSPQSYEMPIHSGMDPFWTSAEGAYEKWLFHGPRFQCIKNIQGISKGGMLSTLVPSSPKACVANASSGNWLIDPIVIDSGPQLAILWARNYLDITPLPSSFKAVHLYQPFNSASSIQCHFQVLENHSKQSVCANVFYVDQQGNLLGMIERLESTGSRALNRLAGSHLFYTDSE